MFSEFSQCVCMFSPQKAVGLETSARRPAAAKPTRASLTSKPEARCSSALWQLLHSALSTEAPRAFVLYLTSSAEKGIDLCGQCAPFRIFYIERHPFSTFVREREKCLLFPFTFSLTLKKYGVMTFVSHLHAFPQREKGFLVESALTSK